MVKSGWKLSEYIVESSTNCKHFGRKGFLSRSFYYNITGVFREPQIVLHNIWTAPYWNFMDFILKKRTKRPLGGGQLVVFVDSFNCVRVPHNCTCVFACVRPMSSCVPMSTSPLCCCRVRQAFLFSRDQDKLSAEGKPESIFLCWFLSNAESGWPATGVFPLVGNISEVNWLCCWKRKSHEKTKGEILLLFELLR